MSYMGKNTSLKAKKIIEQKNICSLSILSQFVFFFSKQQRRVQQSQCSQVLTKICVVFIGNFGKHSREPALLNMHQD